MEALGKVEIGGDGSSIKRNLALHCYPIDKWREIFDEFFDYSYGVFDGIKIVSISDIEGQVGAVEYFESRGFQTVLVPHTECASGESIHPLMAILRGVGGITFYSHSKGVTRNIPEANIIKWRFALWSQCFCNVPDIEHSLNTHLFSGPLKNFNDEGMDKKIAEGSWPWISWPSWYYAGAAYWFRNDEVCELFFGVDLDCHTHLAEYMPGLLCPAEQGASIGPEWKSFDLGNKLKPELFKVRLSAALRFLGSDKTTGHSYGEFYDSLCESMTIGRVLEIGVWEGSSIRAWGMTEHNPHVVGIDVDKRDVPDLIQMDTKDYSPAISRFDSTGEMFDLIIDDGSHIEQHQVMGYHALFKYLKPGGFYVIEDVQTEEAMSRFQSTGWNLVDMRCVKNRYDDIIAWKQKR